MSTEHESLLRDTIVALRQKDFDLVVKLIERFLALADPKGAAVAKCVPYLMDIVERLETARDSVHGARNLATRIRDKVSTWPQNPWTTSKRPKFDRFRRRYQGPEAAVEKALPEPELIHRTPHMEFDRALPLQPDSPLEVRVYVDTRTPRDVEKSVELLVPAGSKVDIHLETSSHFAVEGPAVQTLVITGKERSDELPFRLKVKSRDALRHEVPPTITALFFYNGRPSGKVSREAAIAGLGAPAMPVNFAPARLELQNAPTPDLSITIIATEENDGRHFKCTLSTPLLDAYSTPITVPWNLGDVAKEVVRGYMQAFTAKKPNPGALIAELRGAGIKLFKASPKPFQKLFWELIDAKKIPRQIRIVSEEPYIPWELMVPRRRTAEGTETRLPLGVEFPIGRWIPPDFVAGRPKIPLTDSYVIAPAYPGKMLLKFAESEKNLVVQNFSGEPVVPATLNRSRTSSPLKGDPWCILFATARTARMHARFFIWKIMRS